MAQWLWGIKVRCESGGQYTQQDPIGLAGGTPLLSQYIDDPLNWVDPLGLSPTDPYRFSSKSERWHSPKGSFVEAPTTDQMRDMAKSKGWNKTHSTGAGFETWSDSDGQKRMKLKPGSTQAGLHANSQRPRVTVWDQNGQRVDGFNRPVTRKSVTAHAPLKNGPTSQNLSSGASKTC